MKGKQTMFFSMFSDIESILRNAEESYKIQYFEMGLFDNREVSHYSSIFEINDLEFTSNGDWNYDRRLLIIPQSIQLKIRDVPQRGGTYKYAVDPVLNPISICLQLGGVFKDRENVLVAGKVGTLSESEFSSGLYKNYSSGIRKAFKKIDGFFVGKAAEEKLRQGWRLVLDEGRNKAYDLVLP